MREGGTCSEGFGLRELVGMVFGLLYGCSCFVAVLVAAVSLAFRAHY